MIFTTSSSDLKILNSSPTIGRTDARGAADKIIEKASPEPVTLIDIVERAEAVLGLTADL